MEEGVGGSLNCLGGEESDGTCLGGEGPPMKSNVADPALEPSCFRLPIRLRLLHSYIAYDNERDIAYDNERDIAYGNERVKSNGEWLEVYDLLCSMLKSRIVQLF